MRPRTNTVLVGRWLGASARPRRAAKQRYSVAFIGIACFLALAASFAPVEAPYVQDERRGAVTLLLRVEGRPERDSPAEGIHLLLSGEIDAILAVEGPASLEIEPLTVKSLAQDWRLVGSSPIASRIDELDHRCWQQVIRLAPVRPGSLHVEIEPLKFREKSTAPWEEVEWKPIPVRVTTEIGYVDLRELRDIRPPEALPAPPSGRLALLWPIITLGGAVLFVGLYGLRRLRARQTPALPPEQWARQELDQLEAGNLAGDEVERYHTRLTDIIRRYMGERCHVRATTQTTAEFLATMRVASCLSEVQQALLREFLDCCDLVKFAGASPSPEECRSTFKLARRLIEETATLTLSTSTEGRPC